MYCIHVALTKNVRITEHRIANFLVQGRGYTVNPTPLPLELRPVVGCGDGMRFCVTGYSGCPPSERLPFCAMIQSDGQLSMSIKSASTSILTHYRTKSHFDLLMATALRVAEHTQVAFTNSVVVSVHAVMRWVAARGARCRACW